MAWRRLWLLCALAAGCGRCFPLSVEELDEETTTTDEYAEPRVRKTTTESWSLADFTSSGSSGSSGRSGSRSSSSRIGSSIRISSSGGRSGSSGSRSRTVSISGRSGSGDSSDSIGSNGDIGSSSSGNGDPTSSSSRPPAHGIDDELRALRKVSEILLLLGEQVIPIIIGDAVADRCARQRAQLNRYRKNVAMKGK